MRTPQTGGISVRPYEANDAASTLAVFLDAVTVTAADVERLSLERATPSLTTNASITARPFFERFGFVVLAEQHPVTRGVRLTNYRMEKRLGGGEDQSTTAATASISTS